MYPHEAEERRPNVAPICTTMPLQSLDQYAMDTYLRKRGLDSYLAMVNGWYLSMEAGDYFPRVVIPAVTLVQNHVYWQARDTTGKAYLRYQSPNGPRHEALIRVLPKGKVQGVVILEGPCCALRAAMHGYVAFALMGVLPSQATLMHLALLLHDYPDQNIVVLLDRDSAQHDVRVSTFLASQGYANKIGKFPSSTKDLAEMPPNESEALLNWLFQNLFTSKNSVQPVQTELGA